MKFLNIIILVATFSISSCSFETTIDGLTGGANTSESAEISIEVDPGITAEDTEDDHSPAFRSANENDEDAEYKIHIEEAALVIRHIGLDPKAQHDEGMSDDASEDTEMNMSPSISPLGAGHEGEEEPADDEDDAEEEDHASLPDLEEEGPFAMDMVDGEIELGSYTIPAGEYEKVECVIGGLKAGETGDHAEDLDGASLYIHAEVVTKTTIAATSATTEDSSIEITREVTVRLSIEKEIVLESADHMEMMGHVSAKLLLNADTWLADLPGFADMLSTTTGDILIENDSEFSDVIEDRVLDGIQFGIDDDEDGHVDKEEMRAERVMEEGHK